MDSPALSFAHPKNLEEQLVIDDPIVAEVRRYRREHTLAHGSDLNRIVADLRKRERESKRPLLNPGPKLILEHTGS